MSISVRCVLLLGCQCLDIGSCRFEVLFNAFKSFFWRHFRPVLSSLMPFRAQVRPSRWPELSLEVGLPVQDDGNGRLYGLRNCGRQHQKSHAIAGHIPAGVGCTGKQLFSQVPLPTGCGAVHTVCDGPPDTSIFLSSFLTEKPMNRLSGDQNGDDEPSVPCKWRHSRVLRSRIHSPL